MLFRSGKNELGFMNVKLPLLLCTRTLAVRPWPDPLTVVEVPDLHERILTCDMDVLEKCFECKIGRTDLDRSLASSRAVRLAAESMPASATMMRSFWAK